MRKISKGIVCSALSLGCVLISFVPEKLFATIQVIPFAFVKKYLGECGFIAKNIDAINILLVKLIVLFVSTIIFISIAKCYLLYRKKIIIRGEKYEIVVEYGDILTEKNSKKVIGFDECFTTNVSDRVPDIKHSSICGKYLRMNPDLNIQSLLTKHNIIPAKRKSEYNKQICYEPGTLVPNGDFLLMAFARLNKDGLAFFDSHEDYLDCLSHLWKEIDKYYCQQDVSIPILGSGLTRIGRTPGDSPSKQDLLNWIILSYKISPYKLKRPYKLHIVCNKSKNFSINAIE